MSALEIGLALPGLGRPHFVTLAGDQPVRMLPVGAVTAVGAPGTTDAQAAALLPAALASVRGGGLGLRPVGGGAASGVIPLTPGSPQPLEPTADGRPRWDVPMLGVTEDRRLHDVVTAGAGVGPDALAPHAVYTRTDWSDLGIAHVTDTHVARRADSFRSILRDLGHVEAAARVVNVNDRFRGFVRLANRLHADGELDVVVATGDLVDYLFEADDDPDGLGNAGFLRDLILGRAPGPDVPDVEELRVPILMTPGNHDYRLHPYRLVFDLRALHKDWHRVRNFSGIALLEKEARDLDNALYNPGATEVADLSPSSAESMIAIDTALRAYREAFGDTEPHVAVLGPHRIVMVDSAHDVGGADSLGGALLKLVEQWWGSGDEDFATLTGGSPNCEGIDDAEYAALVGALEDAPDDGLVVLALHAPLVNPWQGEYPYFLRATQRPALSQQAHLWLSAHSGGLDERELRREHPGWFAPSDGPEPDYLSRGSSLDLLDYGVSRGRADDALRAIAGVGVRRPADVVLAGHTHHHDEVSVRVLDNGEIAYRLDFFTANPTATYPTKVVVGEPSLGANGRLHIPRETAYVEVEPEAIAASVPHRMPWAAKHSWVVHVPPYAAPLATSADPRAWWEQHRPLLLQTGALGLFENNQVSFAGFRLLSVRGGVIQRVHHLPIDRAEAAGFRLSLADAAAPAPLRTHRHLERTRRTGAGTAAGPVVLVPDALAGSHSLVHRDSSGALVELWEAPGAIGSGRLADAALAPAAIGDPAAYLESSGMRVVVYRGADEHVHSLYWAGTEPAGHDALSASAGAPTAQGDPTAYELGGTKHVIYRADGGNLHELWWTDGAVSHGRITGYCGEPLAAGDPSAYPVTTAGQNVVLYRGVDGHIHSLYWSDGPTGHDNLSGYCGSPLAVGEPRGYHRPEEDAHQVVYRGEDGHLHEIWWVGAAPAQAWDLVAAAGSPAAAGDPAVAFLGGIKHVVYVGVDGHVHDLAWAPGGPIGWTDLTLAALAPPARDWRPTITAVGTRVQVGYVGTDGHVHEVRSG
ncbi:MAG TPA: metallophosphoesterase [Dermatophilaceae bacterium]|nr:metallophosphoesterase [Dermatophilaceae bacterium]